MSNDFVHLHVHSHYSLLDGLTKPEPLLKKCAEYGMDACALTDHGNLFGLLEFYTKAKKYDVKPILGCEVYVSPTDRFDKSGKSSKEASNHLLLLCENEAGYHNLCKLSSLAHLEGWHYKPRVDMALLEEYKEGLIACSACLNGRIPSLLLANKYEEAEQALDQYIGIFGRDNFCIEMMNHGMPEEEKVNPLLWELAEKYKLTAIATNDSHYLEREDAEAHEVLLCLQTKKNMDDPGRMRFPNDEFYFRTQEDMMGRFARWPDAVTNTKRIAERCNATIPMDLGLIPNYPVPEGYTQESYLWELVNEGLEKRYGTPLPQVVMERVQYEMGVIVRMKFVDYFLVVWDLVHFARKAGIPVGPGRGSGAGCLVAYALWITNLDPIHYNLLFERFLNPERVSMPDFDVDFCIRNRDKLIEYSRQKYGAECVSQIGTFGRMLAKNVVRNVARTLGMPVYEANRIATLIPNELNITLEKAAEKEPELRRLIEDEKHIARLWQLALRLEGTINSYGTHAAGVVLCDHPLTDHIALFKAANSDVVTTQTEMKGVEQIGLLKMDILGLRTLTMISDAVKMIKKNRGIDIDIDSIPLDDEKTYDLLRSGQTFGVFQLESSGMRELAKRIGLENVEEISALVALYRPGPMAYLETYITNKKEPGKISYNPPAIKPVLEETYGICLYQEQVMQLVQLCGGFSLGRADLVRRAMGKKNQKLLDEQKIDFVKGCAERNISKELANDLWGRIETFAGYGFNKSHSMAYAVVAYQTAYLKAHYTEEFLCALLSSMSGDLKKIALYIAECRNLDVAILPPDINHSEADFCVENNAIRFGLSAIKNVGEGPCQAIVEERQNNGPYKDVFDFCGRLCGHAINSRTIESLNKAGAFLGTGWNRRQVAEVAEQAISAGQVLQRERAAGQTSLFDLAEAGDEFEMGMDKPHLPEWPEHELLAYEKETTGLYVTGHPLNNYESLIRRYSTLDLATLDEYKEGDEANVCGMITEAKKHYNRKGDAMAFLTLETMQGPCEMTVFSDLYEQKKNLLEQDFIITCCVRVNVRDDKNTLVVTNLIAIDETEATLTKAVHIRLNPQQQEEVLVHKLALLLGGAQGTCDVYLHCGRDGQKEAVVHATSACRVAPSPQLAREVENLLGENALFLSAGMGLPSHQPKRTYEENNNSRWRGGKRSYN